MKKNIVFVLLLVPALLLVLTGCDKKEEKKENPSDTKTIELTDEKFGYKTTFTYNKNEDYSDIEVDTESGKTTEIEFENEELDLDFQMYYVDTYIETYETTEKSRSAQKYYKEYTYVDYKGYAYGNYGSSLQLNILIDTNEEEHRAKVLFVSIDRKDSNEDIIVSDVVADTKVQEFFNSMEVEKLG